jgi:hypothetical protein
MILMMFVVVAAESNRWEIRGEVRGERRETDGKGKTKRKETKRKGRKADQPQPFQLGWKESKEGHAYWWRDRRTSPASQREGPKGFERRSSRRREWWQRELRRKWPRDWGTVSISINLGAWVNKPGRYTYSQFGTRSWRARVTQQRIHVSEVWIGSSSRRFEFPDVL